MVTVRLDSEERRKAIVEAAMPLFARKGFSGTTTKEIAEKARISEALLFKHFPTKGTLYQEMLRSGCSADPALERLQSLEPCTRTLIHMMHFMVLHLVVGAFGNVAEREPRLRLVLNSFLEDGEFARLVFEWVSDAVMPKFIESVAVAEAAGDVVATGMPAANRFWYAHQLAVMIAAGRLPGGGALPLEGDMTTLIGQMVRFILRGLGMTDEVIAAQYDPAALSIFLQCPDLAE